MRSLHAITLMASSLSALAVQINQYNASIEFVSSAGDPKVGQFMNGDYWVVAEDGLELKSTAPYVRCNDCMTQPDEPF